MESVESYLKLSQLGLSVPVNYNIAVDEKLEEFQILPLSVLTFVENAVKYGVQSKKHCSSVFGYRYSLERRRRILMCVLRFWTTVPVFRKMYCIF